MKKCSAHPIMDPATFSYDFPLRDGVFTPYSRRDARSEQLQLCRVAETDPASGDLDCVTTLQCSARGFFLFPRNALGGLVSPAWTANNTGMAVATSKPRWYARPETRQQQKIRTGGLVTRPPAGVTALGRYGMNRGHKARLTRSLRLECCRPLPGSRGVRSAVTIATATGEWLHTKVAHRNQAPLNTVGLGGLVYSGLVHHRKSRNAMTQWEQTQELARNAGFKDYQDYLQSEHWKKLKQRCSLVQCCVCGTMKALVAHHIRYKNLLDVAPIDIVAMCERCHEDFHMACRQLKVAYVEKEAAEIASITNGFRTLPWYSNWLAKRARKKERREAKKPKPPQPRVMFWVCDPRGEKMLTVPLAKKSARNLATAIKQIHRIKAQLKSVCENPF